jgi:hypothetical protein
MCEIIILFHNFIMIKYDSIQNFYDVLYNVVFVQKKTYECQNTIFAFYPKDFDVTDIPS